MYNCIFSGHCTEDGHCNTSCPALAQTTWLLEQNKISMNNPVFRMDLKDLNKYTNLLSVSAGRIATVVVTGGLMTNQAADALTYCAICENWRGSQLHTTVYNLRYAQYLDETQKSWSFNSDDSTVEYIKMWTQKAKVLIISNIDFVNFRDFQCQTLLSLLQSRSNTGLTTIVVSPPFSSLVGDSQFFGRLTDTLKKQKVGEAG